MHRLQHANGLLLFQALLTFSPVTVALPLLLASILLRKTVKCCLENLCARTIERKTAVNSHPERFQANHEILYEPEKRTELIQTTFKLIRFTGQCALGDIDFLCSLPCGFVVKDERSDLLVEFLLRPQRPLLDTRPLIRPLAARSFRPRHLPLPFAQTTITSSVPDPLRVDKTSRRF